MAADNPHVGDVGFEFLATLTKPDGSEWDLDAAAANDISFVFRRPSGATLTVDGDFKTDGTDGVVNYLTEAGDLDESGRWALQVVVGFAGGGVLHSDLVKFKVEANL